MFPDEGSLICAPGKIMIFLQKETEKIELVAKLGRFKVPRILPPVRELESWLN